MKEKQAEQPTAPAPAQPQPPSNVQLEFKVNVRNTGTTKQVSGLDATESILTMQMVGTDTTNGQQGAFAITNDMWMVPEIPGYGEIRDFYMRMGAKMGDMFSASSLSSSLAAMQPAASQGMSQMVKEMSKLKGIPVEQVMRMGATANGEPLPAASEAPLPPTPSAPPPPSAGDVAQQSASSAIASKLGGFGIGGFGGFGHKKQQAPPPPAEDDSNTTQQTPTATVLMESTTQLTEFSSAPIDSEKFSIPAGFTEVQAPQMK
jgi:hypothetical protein